MQQIASTVLGLISNGTRYRGVLWGHKKNRRRQFYHAKCQIQKHSCKSEKYLLKLHPHCVDSWLGDENVVLGNYTTNITFSLFSFRQHCPPASSPSSPTFSFCILFLSRIPFKNEDDPISWYDTLLFFLALQHTVSQYIIFIIRPTNWEIFDGKMCTIYSKLRWKRYETGRARAPAGQVIFSLTLKSCFFFVRRIAGEWNISSI